MLCFVLQPNIMATALLVLALFVVSCQGMLDSKIPSNFKSASDLNTYPKALIDYFFGDSYEPTYMK